MKARLLEWLVCPGCGSNLDAQVFRRKRDERPTAGTSTEIWEALLRCRSCFRAFPVIDGIPRMLPDSLETYGHLLPVSPGQTSGDPEAGEFRKLHASTRESFSFEWLRYRVTSFAENAEFFQSVTGFGPPALGGKLVLDAGCGMGRFLEVAASMGAEVVGLDLSRSVERAARESSYPDSVHFVQGDIMNPPFHPQIFDAAYSIGVLHHTPDTRRSFRSLCPLVKRGGEMAVWVYRSHLPEIEVGRHKRVAARAIGWVSDGSRVVSRRMPHSLLHYLCYAAVPLGWLKRHASRHAATRYLLWPLVLPPVSDHVDWRVRLCDTFDWLSPAYQWKHTTPEVSGWFEEEGWERIRPMGRSVSVRARRPLGEAHVARTLDNRQTV